MSLMVAQEVPTSTTMALPHGPTGVADARRRLRTDLHANEVPEPVVDDAVLILSELLSNSCRHARPLDDGDGGDEGGRGTGQAGAQAPAQRLPGLRPEAAGRPVVPRRVVQGIRAAWSVGEDGLLVLEVTDGGGPTRPRPSSPSLTAHGGRGLGIVGSLALRWGVRDAPGEVTVWAVLAVRGRHARRDDSLGTGIGLPRGIPLGLPLDLAESLDDLG
ncbi:ATP-binding protein [Actinacidiphila acidipaludis]|uniref:ATP-binding protein n=1 Tax=Actinacidiphila acidipaludis TaxID=2873382 RepID=A0ABS7Q7R8_9ACTN|nr:ATP-binding protein [Streptomyces acidipaludis]MBY8879205.1 ATP-binding protein [Streptomyces acidipaludis]